MPRPPAPLHPQVRSLTTAEKAALTVGLGSWRVRGEPGRGVRGLRMADGPHGLRVQAEGGIVSGHNLPATCFPTAATLAASWDPQIVAEVAAAIGVEARTAGVDLVLGPGVNIKRNPLCGRNFEYFSEDPLLSGSMGVAWIRGLQSTGALACVKHFAVNNQETRRYSVDAIVDERALREIYLPSFERAVTEADVAAVMTAYNKVNGTYASEHRELLAGVLRGEWGFTGAVISDWGAVNDRVASLRAGLDLQMPQDSADRVAQTVEAVRSGTLPEADLDRAASAVLRLMDRADSAGVEGAAAVGHHELAVRAAAAGTVLLRHEGGLLPLSADSVASVAVIGALADQPRFQGSGSSRVTPTRVDSVRASLEELLDIHTPIRFAPGYTLASGEADPALVTEAADLARACEVAVVVVGLPEWAETEGLDRTHLALPASHDELVRAVVAANPATVVVVVAGGVVELPWREEVPAILLPALGGQGAGRAVVDVIFGAREPGGRLAETMPRTLADRLSVGLSNGPRVAEHVESIYVGYRWFDTGALEVAYPFGHGLSLTTFEWSEIHCTPTILDAVDTEATAAEVTVRVENTGPRAGSDVVQVYLSKLDKGVARPVQVLAGFAKVHLEPGEAATVRVAVPNRAFAHYWVRERAFAIEDGFWEVRVSRSSRDVVARLPLATTGGVQAGRGGARAAYRMDSNGRFSRQKFASLIRKPLPLNEPDQPGGFTVNTPFRDLRATALGQRLHELVSSVLMEEAATDGTHFAGSPEELADQLVPRMLILHPLVTPDVVQAFVDAANGRWSMSARRAVAGFPLLLARVIRSRGRTR